MAHTIRICKDLTGWFASMGDDATGYPGVSVHWEQAFRSPEDAMGALDLAQALAQRLRGPTLRFWKPKRRPTHSSARRHNPRPNGSSVVVSTTWVADHYEGGRALVVVRVSNDRNGHGVRLTDSRGHSEAVVYYPIRQMAFEVAEKLIRVRYRDHVCSAACSGWTEDVDVH
jgi:hypothetical protein